MNILNKIKKNISGILVGAAILGAALMVSSVASATVFPSQQVGANPVNGYYLQTNGATSTWAPVSGGSGSGTVFLLTAGNNLISLSPASITASGTISVNTSTLATFVGTLGYISSSTGNTLYLQIANNLSDLSSTSSARTNIGYSGGLKITISSTGTIGLTTSSISQFNNDSGYTTNTGTVNSLTQGNGITLTPSTITTTGVIQLNTSTVNALITAFGYITSAPGTSTLTAGGGTATGPAITLATSTSAGTFNIVCGVSTCTITIPPKNDQFYAPSTTIPTVYVTSFGGMSGIVTTNASTGIAITNSGGVHSIQNVGVTSLNGATGTLTYSVTTSGAGITSTVATAGGNSTTTITNTGVTSFTGQGCVTAANSTGTVNLSVTCISGNQNITFTINGDATGTASGATSITDTVTVTGLNGKALPANTTGTLQYSQGAWAINLATSSLGLYDVNGKLSSYGGSTYNPSPNCVTGVTVSPTGTVTGTSSSCGGAGGGGLASTTPFTVGNLAIVSSSGAIATYGGNSCASGVQTGISASGTALCQSTSTLGLGSGGTVVTSSAVSTGYYPFWVSSNGLSGTSTEESVSMAGTGTGTSTAFLGNVSVGSSTVVTSTATFSDNGSSSFNAVINSPYNVTGTPHLQFGNGNDANDWGFGFAGNRAMVGYTTQDLFGNEALVLNAGSSKGIDFYTAGTNAQFQSGNLVMSLDTNGHMDFGTSSVTAVGGTVVGNPINGKFTNTVASTSYGITFANAFIYPPGCIVTINSGTAVLMSCNTKTTNATFTVGSALPTGTIFSYWFFGASN